MDHFIRTVLSLFAAGIFLAGPVVLGGSGGCGGSGGGGGGGGDEDISSEIVNENGDAITSVDTNDPVNLTLSDLDANTQYRVSVTNPSGDSLSPDGGFIITSDEEGNLPSSTIVQDLSTTQSSLVTGLILRNSGIVPTFKAETGEYTVIITDADGDEVGDPITFDVTDGNKAYCSDLSGTGRASFTPGQIVYVTLSKGTSGDLADGSYTCYVVSDLNSQLDDQDTLAGTSTPVTVVSGEGTASFGSSFAVGAYDVICDIDGDGKYDRGDDLISRAARFRPCFTIQAANSGNDIIGQICSDRSGNYRDIFDPDADDSTIRDVWAWISPAEQSLVQHATGVCKYVVDHQSTWTDQDDLSDVTGGKEVDPVQGWCTNEAPWLVWPRELLEAGCYDCVIDVDCDGKYDKGTDFLDNIDNSGDDATGGMCVADSACAGRITITSPSDDGSVATSTTTLSGSLSDLTMTDGQAIITKGSSSNTVTLTPDAAGVFSSTIPLFDGENIITVKFKKTDGTFCAKTIQVTANYSSASSGELLHITATWDQDTDIDLHFVKPSGAYDNQASEGSLTDCNYDNCNAGEGIDWGTAGDDDDDPVLDIDDCVGGSCSNGRTENIVMTVINEEGAYKIYTDAYADQAGAPVDVTVKVFIKGAQVGTVSCSDQRNETATDTCFVGTITWTGTGTDGNGAFTASGTLASDF